MADELARFRVALEDLLALGRLDAGAHEATPCVTGAVELVTQSLRAAGHPEDLVHVDPSTAAGLAMEVDRLQMLRALTNLIRNADVHGGGLAGVEVAGGDAHVDVVVQDCGPGVPTEDRERIFERFARAGGQKAGTGSGLGLSIVARTIHNHGGEVWCEDRPGGGASFTVRLPRARAS
jgi:signal transduction histidine kinase